MRRFGERIAWCLPRVIAERLGHARATAGAETAAPATADGNPFLAARHEFMNAFGDLARGKRNWQLIAYALAGLLALLAIADLRLAASSRVVPYVVRVDPRSEEHTSELQSHSDLVCRLLLEKKKKKVVYYM